MAVDRSGIDCSIVIIDNNSTDNTAEFVEEYRHRLPIILLRETRPGKNCALNKALRECVLKNIVVFSDDDVTPDRNWLQEIVRATTKWPEIAVFGGSIELLWPDNRQPVWVAADWIKAFGYSWHHYADGEALYNGSDSPFGPNFWVRKLVFQKVPFFDESIGPRPKNRIMGSETLFLLGLHRAGFQMLYCPAAMVQHRIHRKECRVSALQRRGFTFGRGKIRLNGLHRHRLYVKSKFLWFLVLMADYLYASLRFLFGSMLRNPRRNCEITVDSMVRFGRLRETMIQVMKRTESKPRDDCIRNS